MPPHFNLDIKDGRLKILGYMHNVSTEIRYNEVFWGGSLGILSYVNGTVKNRGNQSKEKSKYRHNKILTLENTSEFVEVGFRIFSYYIRKVVQCHLLVPKQEIWFDYHNNLFGSVNR